MTFQNMTVFRAALALLLCLPTGTVLAFGFQDVVEKAKERSASGWSAPDSVPRFMRDISRDAYRGIRFKNERSIWHESNSQFQVRLLPAGNVFEHPVRLHTVDSDGAHPVPFRKTDYEFTDVELERRIPADLGHAGFELTWPAADGEQNRQVIVSFAGASAFHANTSDRSGGSSARGIAIDTGLMSGEEFPAFTDFWLERPAPDAHAMKFHALLDGPSLTGAYLFTLHPGDPTRMQVEAVLFPREEIAQLGVAPLSAMFFYGENTARPAGHWRPEVHDADGLLVHDGGSDEWIWRPLINPSALQIDSFHTGQVRGFGLFQRDSDFDHYQDLSAAYEQRDSAWIEPQGDWGNGRVMLVQLPTPDATNDNAIAFWTPDEPPEPGQPLRLSYQIHFGSPEVASNPLARTVNTFVGDGGMSSGAAGTVRFHIDFVGGPLEKMSPQAAVTADVSADSEGEIVEHFVEYHPAIGGWRLSVLARPAQNHPLVVRAHLRESDERVSETWSYVLPAKNDIVHNAR